MAKTIQVRVEDDMKTKAEMLFASLGMDTSTAIRIFLTASMETGGIPFRVAHRYYAAADPIFEEDHQTLRASLAEIEEGAPGCSLEELDASMKAAIAKGATCRG
jgi:addiction module RelB/DinJ family antitoxin